MRQKQVDFNPLSRATIQPHLLPEFSAIPESLVLQLVEDLMPTAPSAMQTQSREWNILAQMQAGGYSLEIIRNHCLRRAFY